MALPTLPTPGISTGWGLSLNNHLEALRATIVAEAPGIIKAFGGTVAPANHAMCNGAVVSRSGTYANLFSAIGTTFGAGDGSTTFALPNGKGRTLVGRDTAQVEFDALGEPGGAKTHTLTSAEMPGHNHGGSTAGSISNAHQLGEQAVREEFYNNAFGLVTPSQGYGGRVMIYNGTAEPVHTHTISSQGGGVAHNNLQPYLVVNYIITL